MFSQTKEFKAGSEACYAGLPYNSNPFLHKGGFIDKMRSIAWERGFKFAESQARGV